MTKLELDSSYSDARKLGECFVGCEVNQVGKLVGYCHYYQSWLYGEDEESSKITLDLSTSKPNIYKLMEHGFKVEIELENATREFDFSDFYYEKLLFQYISDFGKIKSIKILDLDQLEGVQEVPNEL